jgi:hypothetical protein
LRTLILALVLQILNVNAQQRFKELSTGDSLIYYQCHVEEAVNQLSTLSGQTLTAAPDKYSITEKFVIIKDSSFYRLKHYSSSLLILPNRKFSGLKIKERSYWNFKLQKDTLISHSSIYPFIEVERKGRETTEYDFTISKYNTNQVIIKKGKSFRQLLIPENYILSHKFFSDRFTVEKE